METTDSIILNHILEDKKQKIAPELSESKYFELFVSEQILKNYDLSYDEIESGIVGDGNDGGIDSIYTFINGRLLSDDVSFEYLKSNIIIDLKIIQSKTKASFSESAIQKFIFTTQDLFNLNNSISSLNSAYNIKLLEIVNNFRKIYLELSTKFPEFYITYYYATKGDHIHQNVKRLIPKLEQTVKEIFSYSHFSFEFVGARNLVKLVRQSPTEPIELKVAETPISTGKNSSICLVSLRDYYFFMTDNEGELRKGIFEANVRDYQGSVDVNKAIKDTLLDAKSQEEFWWLNNGITIVASEAPLNNKIMTIKDAQIVNGLQTSKEIYNYFRRHPNNNLDEKRNILVRVILPPNENSRNKIIKATNSQTNIPSFSLRATDEIQKAIEQFFETKEFFYDRRKNYYKNLGYPKDKIISIPYLAQAIIAILLQEPSTALGSAAGFIRDQKNYKRVFDESYPITMFFTCVKLMKIIDSFLVSENAPEYISGNERNVRFHLAMFVVSIKAQKSNISAADIPTINLDDISELFLANCLKDVWNILEKLHMSKKGKDINIIARSREFDIAIQRHLHDKFKENEDFLIPLSVWEKRLAAYIKEHGHCSISKEDPETAELGRWVIDIRIKKRKGLLSKKMIQRLENIGLDWNPIANRWEQRYQELVEYKNKYGDCKVPLNFENKALSFWVKNQRNRKDSLTQEQIKLLDKIGFTWRSIKQAVKFEERVDELIKYKNIYGHVNVPQLDSEYKKLGRWLNDQRLKKSRGKLSKEHEKILNEVGVSWNILELKWEQRLNELKAFHDSNGHFKVPYKYKEAPGLNAWVYKIRTEKPSSERLKKLKSIGYIWEIENKKINRRKKQKN